MSTSDRLNTSKSQEELRLWYSILKHYDIKNTQGLLQHGIIIPKQLGAGTCVVPMCRSCMAGKTKRVGHKSTHHTPNQAHTDALKQYNLQLGDHISTDQYEGSVWGRFP